MLIICPSCDTNFTVADHLIGPKGRVLRCAQCQHQWQFQPGQMTELEIPSFESATSSVAKIPAENNGNPEASSPAEATEDEKSPIEAFADKIAGGDIEKVKPPRKADALLPPRQKRNTMRVLVVSASILIVIGFALFISQYHDELLTIGEDFSERAASLLPSDHDHKTALEISNIKFVRQINNNGEDIVSVEGTIFNLAKKPMPLPPLAAIATDNEGRELLPGRSFGFLAQQIQPGESLDFQAVIRNLPKEAQHIKIGFTKGPEDH